MDNLIAEKKTRPFIVVMTYGMTNDIRFGRLREFDIRPFQTVLCDELIPYIDTHFRTVADQSNRAMAGLSMGGMETKTITLKKLDVFSHIGLFSGGSIAPGDIENLEKFKKSNRLVFVSYGSHELGSGSPRRGGDPKEAVEALKGAGINAQFYVSPKTGHEWQTWRRSLREFAPHLFQEKAAPVGGGKIGRVIKDAFQGAFRVTMDPLFLDASGRQKPAHAPIVNQVSPLPRSQLARRSST
jgi:enterochelin esterase-like enzyme